jgi:hypothetical protein
MQIDKIVDMDPASSIPSSLFFTHLSGSYLNNFVELSMIREATNFGATQGLHSNLLNSTIYGSPLLSPVLSQTNPMYLQLVTERGIHLDRFRLNETLRDLEECYFGPAYKVYEDTAAAFTAEDTYLSQSQ